MMGYGEVPPFTFAAAPLDEWERTQLTADLNRRHRERNKADAQPLPEQPPHVQGFIDLRPEVAAIQGLSVAVTRIEAHSKSDDEQKDAEGEQ